MVLRENLIEFCKEFATYDGVPFEHHLKTMEGNDMNFSKWKERIRDVQIEPRLFDVIFLHKYARISLNVWVASTKENTFRLLFWDGQEGHPDNEHFVFNGANFTQVSIVGRKRTFDLRTNSLVSASNIPHFGNGLLLRLNYLAFTLWCALYCFLIRPSWIYASDLQSCLPAAIARRLCGAHVVYHEHDTPSGATMRTRIGRWLGRARLDIARTAELCILPQAERLEAFRTETGRIGPTLCVWNCPMREEVVPARGPIGDGEPVSFYYHGSLSAERLPMVVIEALAQSSPDATLTIVGYETVGSRGYISMLLAYASELGLGDRVRYSGALSTRAELLAETRRTRVGLAFMPSRSTDINMIHMVGASNKPFDFLAGGLALLVSDLPDWTSLFVAPGYGLSCNPFDARDLAAAMRWCAEHPSSVCEMGEAGRQRVIADWHYERCFAEVLAFMQNTSLSRPVK